MNTVLGIGLFAGLFLFVLAVVKEDKRSGKWIALVTFIGTASLVFLGASMFDDKAFHPITAVLMGAMIGVAGLNCILAAMNFGRQK